MKKNNYLLVGFKFLLIDLLIIATNFAIVELFRILGSIFNVADSTAIFVGAIFTIFSSIYFCGYYLIKYKEWIYR